MPVGFSLWGWRRLAFSGDQPHGGKHGKSKRRTANRAARQQRKSARR